MTCAKEYNGDYDNIAFRKYFNYFYLIDGYRVIDVMIVFN